MRKKERTTKIIPVFKNDAKERAFWDAHTHDIDDYFEPEPVDDIILAIKLPPKKPVTLRLDQSLIDALKETAARHNMGYQTLARELLRHALSGPSLRPGLATVKSKTKGVPRTKT
jgi:predicted DNA binding CopG/RHH family protein